MSRAGSDYGSAVSDFTLAVSEQLIDLDSITSHDGDISAQYDNIVANLTEIEKDVSRKLLTGVSQRDLDAIQTQTDYLGGLFSHPSFQSTVADMGLTPLRDPIPEPPDYYTPEQRLEFYIALKENRKPPKIPRPQSASASASASAATQHFDISDEGQPEELKSRQREFLRKQTVAELKKYAEPLNVRPTPGMKKKDVNEMIINRSDPETAVEPRGKRGRPRKY